MMIGHFCQYLVQMAKSTQFCLTRLYDESMLSFCLSAGALQANLAQLLYEKTNRT